MTKGMTKEGDGGCPGRGCELRARATSRWATTAVHASQMRKVQSPAAGRRLRGLLVRSLRPESPTCFPVHRGLAVHRGLGSLHSLLTFVLVSICFPGLHRPQRTGRCSRTRHTWRWLTTPAAARRSPTWRRWCRCRMLISRWSTWLSFGLVLIYRPAKVLKLATGGPRRQRQHACLPCAAGAGAGFTSLCVNATAD